MLHRQYNTSLHERLVLSRNKEEVMRLASEGLVISKPADIVKQSTVLDCLGLEEKIAYFDKEKHDALVEITLSENSNERPPAKRWS